MLTDEMMQDSNCQMTVIMHHLDVVKGILAQRSAGVVMKNS